MKTSSALATLVLLVFAAAPMALAQGTSTKKKGTKPAASASASAAPADSAAPAAAEPSAAPSAEPAASATATADAPQPTAPPTKIVDSSDTHEDPNEYYNFVGVRYRGTIVPAFLEHLFVNDGGTIYSNTVGLEFDRRHDGHSTIPWIVFTEYGMGDTLFFQKGKPDDPSNYTDVNSSLKAIYLGLDELWSVPVAQHLEFEYGFGVGLGFLFGNLRNDWVYETSSGPLAASNGNRYAPCTSQTVPTNVAENTCVPAAHQGATVAKVNGYVEPNWFGGGVIPVVFPHISFPQLGLRYKPIKQLETRLGLGFSLTGFWFGLSGDYGLENAETHKASSTPRSRDML